MSSSVILTRRVARRDVLVLCSLTVLRMVKLQKTSGDRELKAFGAPDNTFRGTTPSATGAMYIVAGCGAKWPQHNATPPLKISTRRVPVTDMPHRVRHRRGLYWSASLLQWCKACTIWDVSIIQVLDLNESIDSSICNSRVARNCFTQHTTACHAWHDSLPLGSLHLMSHARFPKISPSAGYTAEILVRKHADCMGPRRQLDSVVALTEGARRPKADRRTDKETDGHRHSHRPLSLHKKEFGSTVNIHRYSPTLRRITVLVYTTPV